MTEIEDVSLSSPTTGGVAPSDGDHFDVVLASLEDAKAEEIVPIDVRGKSALCDFMVITSGRSQRHVLAVADQVLRALREVGVRNIRIEGAEGGDWILIDTGDVIVHIFRPEVREFYNLEKMWLQPDQVEKKTRSAGH